MFSRKVPERVIDLSLPEKDRWQLVIDQDLKEMKRLLRKSMKCSGLMKSPVLQWLFRTLYKASGGKYLGEIDSIAKAVGISTSLATMLNCAYEMSHVPYTPFVRVGCSAGVKKIGRQLVHVRNLDWDLPHIGEGTRILKFVNGAREFVSVGLLGYVGVLSGMLPGAYSVTLNWAPPSKIPGLSWGPSFLLRYVLENCNTYEEAVKELSTSPLATSVFYMVCGVDEACVIERTKNSFEIRKLNAGVLVQTNHFVSNKNSKHNSVLDMLSRKPEVLDYSIERFNGLGLALKRSRDKSSAFRTLNDEQVLAGDTYQQMLFCPKTGEMDVRRYL